MNMNDTIDLSGISADNVYRIRRSKKNGKLISYNEYGKVIIIKNWKSLHVGYGKVVSFENRENCILATMKNVPYDFYEEYNEKTGEVEAVPYEELTRILQELGFAHEYKEDIDKDNIFDVWANLDSGVLITIETWNQDGERGYNSVNCYVPANGLLTAAFADKLACPCGNGLLWKQCLCFLCRDMFPPAITVFHTYMS
jgi:hypothetical protein